MIFDDISVGVSVFVDANILTYYFQPHPALGPACEQLVRRMERGQLIGLTSTHVLGELAHRMMTIEAIDALNWPVQGIGNRLRNNPSEVQKLGRFRLALDEVLHSKIQVLTVSPANLAASTLLCQQIGLLTNDALIVAVMQANGLMHLASNDADFDRVPGLTRYAPV